VKNNKKGAVVVNKKGAQAPFLLFVVQIGLERPSGAVVVFIKLTCGSRAARELLLLCFCK
jgi:hypothetical protein